MSCRTSLPNPFASDAPMSSAINTINTKNSDPHRGNRVATRGIGQPLRVVSNDMIDEAKFFRDIGQPELALPLFLRGRTDGR